MVYHAVHFIGTHQVDFRTDDLLLRKDQELVLSWNRNAVFPVDLPEDYLVDVKLFELSEHYQWILHTTLAAGITNSGEAHIIIPDLNKNHSASRELFPILICVCKSSITNMQHSGINLNDTNSTAGIWTGVAYYSTSGLSYNECVKWTNDQYTRESELNSIDSLPSCPCTVQQARAPNSGLTEQELDFPFQQYFSRNHSSVCFYPSVLKYQ